MSGYGKMYGARNGLYSGGGMMQNLKEISTEELIVKWEEWYNALQKRMTSFTSMGTGLRMSIGNLLIVGLV